MTADIAPALNSEAVLGKSKAYILRALARKQGGDLDEYQLWASLALELFGKAALARIHPSLIADPTHFQSLFAASGINISTDIKTIAAHTLYERLRHLSQAFDEKAKVFCTTISQRRNAELHSGETPFKTMKVDAWESHYWHCAYVILSTMKLNLDDWLGLTQAEAPKGILAHGREVKAKAVTIRIERHKEQFEARKKADREAALKDAEHKEAYHYRGLFTLLSDEEWGIACPACSGRAFLAGVQIAEEVIDTHFDEGNAWESVAKEYAAEQFHCPVCNLWLDGIDELEATGLDTSHEETEEREMQYEPEYGND